MRRRNPAPGPLPERWLFTDERQGDTLFAAIAALPRGSGIVFRHYETNHREALARKVARAARRHDHLLVVADDARLARRVGAAGTHMTTRRFLPGALTAAAHGPADLVRAQRARARLVFLSPVFATRSHAGARPLGTVRFGLMARGAGVAVAALGGMDGERYRRLRALGANGWGAIDAWGP